MINEKAKGRQILVVDDSVENCDLLVQILEAGGWRVQSARDGVEAVQRLSHAPVDLIISDILMPNMDGFQLCRYVKSRPDLREAKFIFLTGNYTDQEDEAFAVSLGADRVLVKPVAPAELLSQVAGLFKESPPRDEPTLPLASDAFLAEHNVRLVNKLEKKVQELEEVNNKLLVSEASLAQYTRRLEAMVEERTQALMESQESLFRQERLAYLGRLAGEVSHELRTPLSTIANAGYYLQSVLGEGEQKPEVNEHLEIIISEIHRANRIIHNLLDIATIRTTERSGVAVLPVLLDTLAGHEPPEQLEVTIEACPELPLVYCDTEHLRHILSNLLTNAYRSMPQGGKVTVSARPQGDMMSIQIADQGCGIPAERLEKIFEPLVSFSGKGIGLGLPLARNLAELNNGRIEVQSTPGKGSVFTLFLPLVEKEVEDQGCVRDP
jgi:signal transduction histidine kinase